MPRRYIFSFLWLVVFHGAPECAPFLPCQHCCLHANSHPSCPAVFLFLNFLSQMKDLHATGALLALMVATFAPGVKTVHITLTVANFDDGAFRHAASCAPRLYSRSMARRGILVAQVFEGGGRGRGLCSVLYSTVATALGSRLSAGSAAVLLCSPCALSLPPLGMMRWLIQNVFIAFPQSTFSSFLRTYNRTFWEVCVCQVPRTVVRSLQTCEAYLERSR